VCSDIGVPIVPEVIGMKASMDTYESILKMTRTHSNFVDPPNADERP
jgi:hypothetical protein